MARQEAQHGNSGGFNPDAQPSALQAPDLASASAVPTSPNTLPWGTIAKVAGGLAITTVLVEGCASVPGSNPDQLASQKGNGGSTTTGEGDPAVTATPSQTSEFQKVLKADVQTQIKIVTGKFSNDSEEQKEQDALLLQLKIQAANWKLNNTSAPMVDPYSGPEGDFTNYHGFILNEVKTADGSQYWLFATLNPTDSSKMVLCIIDQGSSDIFYSTPDPSVPDSGQNQDNITGNVHSLQPISSYDVLSRTQGQVVDLILYTKIQPSQVKAEGNIPELAAYDNAQRAHFTANQQLAAIMTGRQQLTDACPFIINGNTPDQLAKIDAATLQANATQYPGFGWNMEPWLSPVN